MRKLTLIGVFLAVAVSCTSAVCCGRGVHGFCKDCSVIKGIFSRGQKCCGSGSGRGSGCNIFCCNCGTCRKGKQKITYVSGWWFHKKHSCKRLDAEPDAAVKDMLITHDVFNSLDKDSDKAISPDEFLEGLRAHLNKDFESSYSMASDLVKSDGRADIVYLLDAAQTGEAREDEADEIDLMAKEEFSKMDADGNGFIQANEFDKDLE